MILNQKQDFTKKKIQYHATPQGKNRNFLFIMEEESKLLSCPVAYTFTDVDNPTTE